MEFICALVPHFSVALARRDNPALQALPVVTGQASEARGSVIDCSDEAMRAGVAPGMLITRAQVLCPSAAVIPMREEQAKAAGEAFADVLADLCPATEAIEPGHVHADVRGMAKLAGLGPAEYLAELQETIAGLTGLAVRVGGASTVFVAHAAAGFLAGPSCHIARREGEEALGPLPVEALPVSNEMLRRLHLFGLERLGQVGELPPTALQAQFGREGLLAWRLIHCEEPGRLMPRHDEVRIVERVSLPAPAVMSTPLVLGTEIVLQRALRHPEADGRALRRADWVAELENEERLSLPFVFREPTADPARMLFVIRNAIERQVLTAPATAIEVTLSGICSEYVRQERLWRSGPRNQEALSEAIEQIGARTRGQQIYRIVEVEPWSRIPERQRALAAYSP